VEPGWVPPEIDTTKANGNTTLTFPTVRYGVNDPAPAAIRRTVAANQPFVMPAIVPRW